VILGAAKKREAQVVPPAAMGREDAGPLYIREINKQERPWAETARIGRPAEATMIVSRFYQGWSYARRHMVLMLRHMTLKRAANLMINQLEYVLRRERLVSYPCFIKIDPSNRCQLRCPGCAQASDEFRAGLPKKGFLTVADFKKIVDPLAATTLGITLSAQGEPLLNRAILEMIEHARSLNIGVTISTNLSIKFGGEYLERLVRSGVDKLMVALDGASSETYAMYRVGGDFGLVRENVKKIAAIKRTLGVSTPELQWKFVEFDHNRHEIFVVPELYKEWGFDSYLIDVDRVDARVEAARKSRFVRKEACFFPYSTMVVLVDGRVLPCCSYQQTAWHLGNALESDIRSLWNTASYRALRRGFARRNYGAFMHPSCRSCLRGGPQETIPSADPAQASLVQVSGPGGARVG
jgi:radical SAM protein with 4Fe4S-binding SPASM domain